MPLDDYTTKPFLEPGTESGFIGLHAQDMVSEVADQIRNVSLTFQIIRWLNLTSYRIYASHPFFPFFFGTGGNTVLGSSQLAYNIQMNPAAVRKVLSVSTHEISDGSLIRELIPHPIKGFFSIKDRLVKGEVTHYLFVPRSKDTFIGGENDPSFGAISVPSLQLFHPPNRDLTLQYTTYLLPPIILSLSEYSAWPQEWYPLLILGAVISGKRYERFPESEITADKQEYYDLQKNLIRNMQSRPDYVHNFQDWIADNPIKGRFPYPVLPSTPMIPVP